MTVDTPETEQSTTTSSAPTLETATFHEFERLRRGETLHDNKAKSAPVEKTEQKKSAKSDTAETEEVEASKSDATEASGDELEEEEVKAEDKGKKKGGWQRRIEKLVSQREAEKREKEAEKRRADAYEQRLAALETAGGSTKQTKATVDGEPNPDSFETYVDYVKALAKWEYNQGEKAKEEKATKAKQEAEHAKVITTYAERAKAFAKAHDDFDEVIADVEDILAPPYVLQGIAESENGPALAYELAKNPTEYARICKLPPIAAARELGKIEAKLSASSEEKKSETKTVTNAPKPVAPVGKGQAKVAKSITDPDVSFQDYVRLRREQMKRRA